MSTAVAKRYARALFKVAKETGQIDTIESQLSEVNRAIAQNEELLGFLSHPHTSKDRKKEIIRSIFAEKTATELLHFLFVLVDRNRERETDPITSEFIRLANEERGIVDARVTTSRSLTEQELDELIKRFGDRIGKQLRVSTEVKPEILGGVIVKIGDRLYDGSIAGKMIRFKQSLNQSQVRIDRGE